MYYAQLPNMFYILHLHVLLFETTFIFENKTKRPRKKTKAAKIPLEFQNSAFVKVALSYVNTRQI